MLQVALALAVTVAMVVVLSAIMMAGRRSAMASNARLHRDFHPAPPLASASVSLDRPGTVQIAAGQGRHRLWLLCPHEHNWGAVLKLHYRIVAPGAPSNVLAEHREHFDVGVGTEDGFNTSGLASDLVYIPRPPREALHQLLALPNCPPGATIQVDLQIEELRGLARDSSFRLDVATTAR